MILTWKPLGIPPHASPEEAFMLAARHSNTSECVMLAWIKGQGWCGCHATLGVPSGNGPAPAIHLMNVGDASIMAIRRIERKVILPGGNGDDNAA